MGGLLTDISARALRALQANETRLGTALKLSDLLIFHQDRQLRYTWIANPALGVSPQDLLGRRDEEILGKAGARPLTAIKRRVLRTGQGERHELWLSLGDATGCFDLIVEPERTPDGRIAGVVCAAADITRRKQAEAERDAAYRALGHLADHVQDQMEEQRRELAREVHDQIGATLTGIRMRLDAMLHGPSHAELLAIRPLIDQALATTRSLCTQLRPPMLDDLGLAETLRWYARDWTRQTGIRASVRIAALAGEPADPLRIDLFRMLQELLTNVARHAGARRIGVSLTQTRHELRLRVRDDGRGFPPAGADGFGLLGIRERLRRHAGLMHIDSTSRGTRVTLTVPVAQP